MTDLILFCLLGILSITIAVLGGHLSSTNHKYRIAFYILGGISVILVIFTGYSTYIAQTAAKNESKRLDDSIRTIKNMSEEAIRIGTINTDLEKQLLEQSRTIADLSKQAISTTTGGDSFCYLLVVPAEGGAEWTPIFVHSGKYPLYGVIARIVDLEKLREILKKPDGANLLAASETLINVGDMSVDKGIGLSWRHKRIPWNDGSEHAINVFFSARNGLWNQETRLRKINGQWVSATRIRKGMRVRGIGKKPVILFSQIDKLFPRNSKGAVDW